MPRTNIHSADIACELDTEALVFTLDVPSREKICIPPLTESTIETTAHNNKPIQFCGRYTVWVRLWGRQAKMHLHVLGGVTRPLCGRDMIRALKINCGLHNQGTHEMQGKPLPREKQKLIRISPDNAVLLKAGLERCATAQATFKFKVEPLPRVDHSE